jgi:hypothetical protein
VKRLLTVIAAIIMAVLAWQATARAATTCTTSAQFGTCSYAPYTINNNMWGEVTGSTQTLTATSAADWSIAGSEPSGGGVKTYPEDQENYASIPVCTLHTTIHNWSMSAIPAHTGAARWEVASDDWLNATPGSANQATEKEIMVWENTYQTSPAGSNTGKTLTINGQVFDLWAKTGTQPTYSFVSTTNVNSGVIHMVDFLTYLRSLGYVTSADKLVQLNMGEEILSTDGTETWTYNGYSNSVATGAAIC